MNTTINQNTRDQFFMSLKERESSTVMKLLAVFLFVTTLVTIFSCKKENPTSTSTITYGKSEIALETFVPRPWECRGGFNGCTVKVADEAEFNKIALLDNQSKCKITATRLSEDTVKISFEEDVIKFTLIDQEEYFNYINAGRKDSASLNSDLVATVYKNSNITGFSNLISVTPKNWFAKFTNGVPKGLNQFTRETNYFVSKSGAAREEVIIKAK